MKKTLLAIAALSLLCACSNEELTELTEVTNNASTEEYYLDITYKGKEYNVLCSLDEDGKLTYLDEDFRKLYENEISRNPNLATLIQGNSKVLYYSTESEMLDSTGYVITENSTDLYKDAVIGSYISIVNNVVGKVQLWDDKNYKDRSVSFEAKMLNSVSIPHLKPGYKFNDKTSSLKIWSYLPNNLTMIRNWSGDRKSSYSSADGRVVFLGYEDNDYKGKVLCCIPENNGGVVEHSNLKRIGWGDKITSFKLSTGHKNDYKANDN